MFPLRNAVWSVSFRIWALLFPAARNMAETGRNLRFSSSREIGTTFAGL
jgi:hypothetical protein